MAIIESVSLSGGGGKFAEDVSRIAGYMDCIAA